jgi:hypothetical protein
VGDTVGLLAGEPDHFFCSLESAASREFEKEREEYAVIQEFGFLISYTS